MTRVPRLAILSMALGLQVFTLSALGQEPDATLEEEIEALKRGQQEIQRELGEIKRLLRAQRPSVPAAPDVAGKTFDIGANPTRGADSAPLTLVEFTDYQ